MALLEALGQKFCRFENKWVKKASAKMDKKDEKKMEKITAQSNSRLLIDFDA